jgi:hypothetical protein
VLLKPDLRGNLPVHLAIKVDMVDTKEVIKVVVEDLLTEMMSSF